jgi:hypothetical protein
MHALGRRPRLVVGHLGGAGSAAAVGGESRCRARRRAPDQADGRGRWFAGRDRRRRCHQCWLPVARDLCRQGASSGCVGHPGIAGALTAAAACHQWHESNGHLADGDPNANSHHLAERGPTGSQRASGCDVRTSRESHAHPCRDSGRDTNRQSHANAGRHPFPERGHPEPNANSHPEPIANSITFLREARRPQAGRSYLSRTSAEEIAA